MSQKPTPQLERRKTEPALWEDELIGDQPSDKALESDKEPGFEHSRSPSPVSDSPPIDSVNWQQARSGVPIRRDAGDWTQRPFSSIRTLWDCENISAGLRNHLQWKLAVESGALLHDLHEFHDLDKLDGAPAFRLVSSDSIDSTSSKKRKANLESRICNGRQEVARWAKQVQEIDVLMGYINAPLDRYDELCRTGMSPAHRRACKRRRAAWEGRDVSGDEAEPSSSEEDSPRKRPSVSPEL